MARARRQRAKQQGAIACYCKRSKGFATQFDIGTKLNTETAPGRKRQAEVLKAFNDSGLKPQYQRGKELVSGDQCVCILKPSSTTQTREFLIRHAKTEVGKPIVGKSRQRVLKNVNHVTIFPSPEYTHGIFDSKGKLLPASKQLRVIRTE